MLTERLSTVKAVVEDALGIPQPRQALHILRKGVHEETKLTDDDSSLFRLGVRGAHAHLRLTVLDDENSRIFSVREYESNDSIERRTSASDLALQIPDEGGADGKGSKDSAAGGEAEQSESFLGDGGSAQRGGLLAENSLHRAGVLARKLSEMSAYLATAPPSAVTTISDELYAELKKLELAVKKRTPDAEDAALLGIPDELDNLHASMDETRAALAYALARRRTSCVSSASCTRRASAATGSESEMGSAKGDGGAATSAEGASEDDDDAAATARKKMDELSELIMHLNLKALSTNDLTSDLESGADGEGGEIDGGKSTGLANLRVHSVHVPVEEEEKESVVDRVLSFVGLARRSQVSGVIPSQSRHTNRVQDRTSTASRTSGYTEVPSTRSFGIGSSLSFLPMKSMTKGKQANVGEDDHIHKVRIKWKFQPAAPPPPKEEKETNVDPKSKTQFFHVFGGW